MTPGDVRTREDLAEFVRGLASEHRRGAAWENGDLPTFLDAFAAWSEDMPGWFAFRQEETPQQPSWWLIANMLQAATIYE